GANNGHSIDAGVGYTKSYIIGFILSIVLTIIPYYLVVNHSLGTVNTYIVILIFAVLQLIVQIVFFLHLNSGSGPKWNLMAFIFTLVVLIILVIGSLWIMANLDYNMMEHM
ncbi:MAG: cytochrome o ubiquinol oxidase subunit IV, partial [Burkholderiales bacterium]|nr:cytochrome o ubiquinol oxidase subunit IV [Burkholderiales bacterium]